MSSQWPASTIPSNPQLVALLEPLALSHQDMVVGTILAAERLAQRVRNHSLRFDQTNRDPKV